MYKVGVVGPIKSVNRILEVAKEFSNDLSFTPLIYHTATETTQIIKEHYDAFDYFLFSGPIPYEVAKQTIKDTKKYFYIHLLETGFYQALLQLLESTKSKINCLSIDIINTSNIVDISLDQLKIPMKEMIVKEFEAHTNYKDLYEYHVHLYKEKKVDAVLTCYPEVMKLLKKDNIPAEWISTTKLATKQVIELIEQRSQISYFKRTQIGVCMIDVDTKVYEEQSEQLSYEIQFATLKMNEELLTLSRDMNGSFFEIGDGKYIVFSSRGEILDNVSLLNETIIRLKKSWKREIIAGIGFGDSALKAEINARKAIYKTEVENKEIIIIDNLGEVIDVSIEHIHSLSTISDNRLILNKLKDKNISIQAFERVRDIIHRKKWNQFTSNDLAFELKMSNRNAQRLLLSFKEAEIVEQVGEEKIAKKGRPRKLYKIKKEYR
ncbi:hypothetical protein SPD48_02310 [Pseudogracilibacillus sp. SE30717A]|uniref:hypothetical protein n=1 Tax=Pseudogracilibacillus sp. SE30717A TaxID=3098293 RepID=UPI00300E2A12